MPAVWLCIPTLEENFEKMFTNEVYMNKNVLNRQNLYTLTMVVQSYVR